MEKLLRWSNLVENSLEEAVTIVYLQNLCTSKVFIIISANALLFFPSQWSESLWNYSTWTSSTNETCLQLGTLKLNNNDPLLNK